MLKSASVLVIDVSVQEDADFAKTYEMCEKILLDKMIYAASDELALVLAGTSTARSTLYEAASQQHYHNITVEHEMGPVSRQMLLSLHTLLHTSRSLCCSFDFIEALTVAADVLQAKTTKKKYERTIYFLTEARHAVLRKAALPSLFASLTLDDVALVVLGVNFSNGSAASALDTLGVKEQNEEVLRSLCATLGEPSKVVRLEDELRAFAQLRCRRVQQKPLLKVPLRVGNFAIAAQLFSLTQQERLPSLQRSTTDGATVTRSVHYETIRPATSTAASPLFSAEGPNDAHAAAQLPRSREVPPEDVEEVVFFGADTLLCTPADRDAMKLHGPASLETVVFVKSSEVSPCVLMGSTRALLPLAGDHDGQRGYNALTAAMEAMDVVMLVRLVARRDADPTLCACFVQQPSEYVPVDGLPRYLVVAPLPFAEDVRAYEFSEYPELTNTAAEEQLMDDIIDGLSVDSTVLNPQKTFNPVLQQYYATLAAKLQSTAGLADLSEREAIASTLKEKHAAAPSASSTVPPLLRQLRGTSTDFFVESSVVYKRVTAIRAQLEACATDFPYADPLDVSSTAPATTTTATTAQGDGKIRAKEKGDRPGANIPLWAHNNHNSSALYGEKPQTIASLQRQQEYSHGCDTYSTELDDVYSLPSLPATIAAAPTAQHTFFKNDASTHRSFAAASCASSDRASVATTLPHAVEEGLHAPTKPSSSDVPSVLDPVESFRALMSQPGVTAAERRHAKDVLRHATLELLRSNQKSLPHSAILACMTALRTSCVRDQDGQYYNDFLLQLQSVAEACGALDDFWGSCVSQTHLKSQTDDVNVGPIETTEHLSAGSTEETAFSKCDLS